MSTTVLEALQNARSNFKTIGKMGAKDNPIFMIAMDQLNNVIAELENDKGPNDLIQDHVCGKLHA